MMDPAQPPRPTKRCPYCAEVILADAVKCKHCGEWLDRSAAPTAAAEVARPVYSKYQEPGQLYFLCFVSFFLYEIYWYYRSWKQMKQHRGLDISPFWRTVGGLVPIVDLFLSYSLFTHIKEFGQDEGVKTYRSPGLFVFFFAAIEVTFWTFFIIDNTTTDVGMLVLMRIFQIFLNFVCVAIPVTVQETLNATWRKKEPDLPIRERHTDGEIVVMIIGVILWIFWFVSLVRDAVRVG